MSLRLLRTSPDASQGFKFFESMAFLRRASEQLGSRDEGTRIHCPCAPTWRASSHISLRREKPRVFSGGDKANRSWNYSLRPEPPGGVMAKSLSHLAGGTGEHTAGPARWSESAWPTPKIRPAFLFAPTVLRRFWARLFTEFRWTFGLFGY
jgi:hypothetical protein